MRQYRFHKALPKAPQPEHSRPTLLSWRSIFSLVPSLGGVGFLPVFPGTWGSLATLAACFMVKPVLSENVLSLLILITFLVGYITVIALLNTQVNNDPDPSYVVIDEAVGQMLALLPVVHHLWLWPVAFVAFRFFDIKKPLLVSWPELNLTGPSHIAALGIMLDDVVAGAYAAGVTFLVYSLWTLLG